MNRTTREKVAFEIVGLARELLSTEKPRKAATTTPEFDATVKAVGSLAQQAKDMHADLIKEINDMERGLQDKKNLLKGYIRDWSKKSGYDAMKKAVLAQAQQCLQVGDMLDGLADGLEVSRRESAQESWKEKYNVLKSMLNEAETAKYSRLLNMFFSKLTTELKTGVKELDGEVKDWHEQAQAIAEERGIKLPKASAMGGAMARLRVRNAGLLDSLMDALRNIMPDLLRRVMDWGKRLFSRVMRAGEELEEISDDITGLVAKVERVIA